MPDVYLLTDGPDGEVAVPQLTLAFSDTGLALAKSDGAPVWSSSWDELEEMSALERSLMPDGRDGVVMVVVERGQGRRHRFVLGTDDAASTEAALRDRAGAHGLRSRAPRRAVSRLVLVGLLLAALAVLTVLLLSAAHVFQF